MSGVQWRWVRSRPEARTDRLPVVAPAGRAVPEQRRPRTLRIPRVRRVILRDPVDRVAAEQLEVVLRGGGLMEAAVVVAEAVIGRHLVAQELWQHVLRAAGYALMDAEQRLAAKERTASAALASTKTTCPRCTAAELCAPHQQVLWRWWDIRDAAAVDVVNLVVAARTTGPAKPASASRRRRSS